MFRLSETRARHRRVFHFSDSFVDRINVHIVISMGGEFKIGVKLLVMSYRGCESSKCKTYTISVYGMENVIVFENDARFYEYNLVHFSPVITTRSSPGSFKVESWKSIYYCCEKIHSFCILINKYWNWAKKNSSDFDRFNRIGSSWVGSLSYNCKTIVFALKFTEKSPFLCEIGFWKNQKF